MRRRQSEYEDRRVTNGRGGGKTSLRDPGGTQPFFSIGAFLEIGIVVGQIGSDLDEDSAEQSCQSG